MPRNDFAAGMNDFQARTRQDAAALHSLPGDAGVCRDGVDRLEVRRARLQRVPGHQDARRFLQWLGAH